jgi:hypothetical protein
MYREEFDKNKFIVFRGFYDLKHVQRMAKRMHFLKQIGKCEIDDQCPLSLSSYSDSVNTEYQELYRKKIESLIGYSLYPTYNYCRIYSPKEILKKHKDRESCEISITTTLDYDTFDDEPWELYVEPDIKIKLFPGDALVYKGCEIEHWRDKFIGIFQTQVFMHYVDVNGPYAKYKYDCRPSLVASKTNRISEMTTNNEEKICEDNSKQETIRASDNKGPLQQRRTKTNVERD